MKKNQHYSGLRELLSQDSEARAYFDSLPDYVQESMQERSQGVNSLESLCHYAQKLTRGDN